MLRPVLATVLVACFAVPANARAAEAHDACTGFIDSIPAWIDTPGTWCLRKDLTTSVSSGYAVVVFADDVTVDCNGFRMTNLGTGDTTGIYSNNPQDRTTVRDCSVRGFTYGTILVGTGLLIEDNRFENNDSGIYLYSDPSAVELDGLNTARRNRVTDSRLEGIHSRGAVVISDNIVDGVGGPGVEYATGIMSDVGAVAYERNIVRNLGGTVNNTGIYSYQSPNVSMRDNVVVAMPGLFSYSGLICAPSNTGGTAVGNQVSGWAANITGCAQSDNHIIP